MLAAAISGYDSKTDPIEDPEIGTIKLMFKSWDVANIDADETLRFEEIPTRPCKREDFTGE